MDDRDLLQVLRALADPNRLRMVRELVTAGELSCGQLGDRFALAQPTMSHHLKVLVEAGVLNVRRDARHHFLSLNRGALDAVVGLLRPPPPGNQSWARGEDSPAASPGERGQPASSAKSD